MMRLASVFLFLLFVAVPVQGNELLCKEVYKTQNTFLEHHILFSAHSKNLEKRALNEFIKTLDSDKIYFLQSDIYKIRQKNKNLFSDLKKGHCQNLYFIYDLYIKRVEERLAFMRKVLKNSFHLKPKVSYVFDADKKRHPRSHSVAKQAVLAYLQYQVSNIFMIEKDLNRSIEYVQLNLDNFYKRVKAWKPNLSPEEIRICNANDQRKNFHTCKSHKFLSNYLDSFARSLDSHSSYMDSDAVEEFKISMELSLEGIGARLSSRFGYTVVEQLIPGGSADESKKIKNKDKILAVGQTPKRMVDIFGLDLQDVVSMIRGKKRTPVYLKILRETKVENPKESKKEVFTKEIFTVKLIRNKINLKEEAAMAYYVRKRIKNKTYQVAVIKVPSFYGSHSLSQKSVTRDVKNLLRHLQTKRSVAVVLDLSHNRGGSLEEAVNLTGLFFSKGNVVKQSEKNLEPGRYTVLSDRDNRIFYNGTLVILVNRLSASASEIVSGTLKDYKRAVIVGGDHTFGKGSVQSVDYVRSRKGRVSGAIKTTVGLYFIPSGDSTQRNGVYSDITLPSLFNVDDLGEKNLDYILPHQKIPSFKSAIPEIFSKDSRTRWQMISSPIIRQLKKRSHRRIKSNEKFAEIKKKLSEFRKKDKSSITVAEVLNRDRKEEDEEEENGDLSEKEKRKKYLERADVEEAVLIALDLNLIQNNLPLPSLKKK